MTYQASHYKQTYLLSTSWLTNLNAVVHLDGESVANIVQILTDVATQMGIAPEDVTLDIEAYDGGHDITCRAQRPASPQEIKEAEKAVREREEHQRQTDARLLEVIRQRSPGLFFDDVIQESPV